MVNKNKDESTPANIECSRPECHNRCQTGVPGLQSRGGLCLPCFRGAGQPHKAAHAFPRDQPDLWFTPAVPLCIELVRHFRDRSTHEIARRVLGAMMADLEMGEATALEMVRSWCIASLQREEIH